MKRASSDQSRRRDCCRAIAVTRDNFAEIIFPDTRDGITRVSKAKNVLQFALTPSKDNRGKNTIASMYIHSSRMKPMRQNLEKKEKERERERTGKFAVTSPITANNPRKRDHKCRMEIFMLRLSALRCQ